jgi:HSP20 family protein
MSKEKRSFFERLTGSVRINPANDDREQEKSEKKHFSISSIHEEDADESNEIWAGDANAVTDEEAELTVDVYQTPDMIVIKSMAAGVRPEDLDINITRDMVTISGKREEDRTVKGDDYFVKELYWGSFSRTISLPEEIDVDESEAIEKHGLIILKLPKLDKKRQAKLKIKTI